MSFRTRAPAPAALAIAAVLAVGGIPSPAPLAAQQDSSMMMAHDSAMMMHGDSGMMSHDSATTAHGQMMEHDQMGDSGGMMFTGAEGRKASGDYALTEKDGKYLLELNDEFAVAAAPDLYLVLANGPTPDRNALYLGKLKKSSGAQAFELPKDKDLTGYSTLLVWSKKEKRAVATAAWHPAPEKAMDHM